MSRTVGELTWKVGKLTWKSGRLVLGATWPEPDTGMTMHCAYLPTIKRDIPNHNTTTYCVYWQTTTTTNPTLLQPQPHVVVTDWRNWQIQHCYDHMLCLLTADNNDKSNHTTTTYCVYWRTITTTNPTMIQVWPCIVLTYQRQKRQPQP